MKKMISSQKTEQLIYRQVNTVHYGHKKITKYFYNKDKRSFEIQTKK